MRHMGGCKSEMRVKEVRHRGQKEGEGWGKSEMSMKGVRHWRPKESEGSEAQGTKRG